MEALELRNIIDGTANATVTANFDGTANDAANFNGAVNNAANFDGTANATADGTANATANGTAESPEVVSDKQANTWVNIPTTVIKETRIERRRRTERMEEYQ